MSRVLVIYASRDGATRDVADAITDELRITGLVADCVAGGHLRELDGTDAVVLGSAISLGRWCREAVHILNDNADRLAAMPFWAFGFGPVPADADDGRWGDCRAALDRARDLGMRDYAVFGRGGPHLDRRERARVRGWAHRIAFELGAQVP